MKLRQALGEFRSINDRMAVWEEVVRHLRKYTGDEGLSPEKTIPSLVGGGPVPEEVVQAVLQQIEDVHVSALDSRLEELGEMEFADDEAEEEPARGKKKGAGRSRASRGDAGARGAGGPLKAVP